MEKAAAINLTKCSNSTAVTPTQHSRATERFSALSNMPHNADKDCAIITVEPQEPVKSKNEVGKSQSGVDQSSLIPVKYDSRDLNYNIIAHSDAATADYRTTTNQGVQYAINHEDTPTRFGGLFQHAESQHYTEQVPAGASDIDIYRQSYLQGQYSQQQLIEDSQHQQLVGNESQQQPQQIAVDHSDKVSSYTQYSGYGGAMDDTHIAAEELASELVQNYGGPNSHMISDILKRNGGQNYLHDGFERPNEMEAIRHFGDNIGTHQDMIHDVDLLNTPQQLAAVDEDCQGTYNVQRGQEQFGDPRASSTPDKLGKHKIKVAPQDYQGSVTYNDIHLHGGKWSTKKSHVYHEHQNSSENPLPPRDDRRAEEFDRRYGTGTSSIDNYPQRATSGHVSPVKERKAFTDLTPFNMSASKRKYAGSDSCVHSYNVPQADQLAGIKSPSSHHSQSQHEITQMTFTPREMMESHLSQNFKYERKFSCNEQNISDVDYSSIYPSRDFIERATGQKIIDRESTQQHNANSHQRKPPRTSKYTTDEIPKVLPQMPMLDSMFPKYATVLPKDGCKHKYFVVNPSEITSMPSKSLIIKYIDFLILENEPITKISKSSNPPVDVYVTEDMYFMDNLKYNTPFPSKKFIKWVASFYPRLNFFEMKFKGCYPQEPRGELLKPDPRPTQQILEDTFYFFQREVMKMENQAA